MAQDLAPYTGATCDWYDLPCHAKSFAEWLFEVLLFIPRKLFDLIMGSLASLVESLPALDAVTQASGAMGALSSAGYVADMCALGPGIAMLITTLLARFLLRRIPFIG